MMVKASGRSALILATGLFVFFATLSAADSGAIAATSKSGNATSSKSVRHGARHWKRYARKSSKSVKSDTRTPTENDLADASGGGAIPASVANANAQLTSADGAIDSARAMTAKANTILLAAADKTMDGQPAADPAVVSSDQLNDVDRALQQNPATQTIAMASAKAAPAIPALASSNDGSTWDQTSLIGKIFIAFGALLTMASAARMFMA
jgi:hypothetical protein